MVVPPTLYAAAPVGAVTNTLLLSWNIVLIQVTKVLIKTLFPVPPHPITVIRSGLNLFFRPLLAFFKLSHSFIFLRITYAILNCSSFRSVSSYVSPFAFLGILM
jgi:hypothetical protein